MRLRIKSMVCNRCIMVVSSILEKFGLHSETITLGEVNLVCDLSKLEIERLDNELQLYGFSIIDDKKGKLIDKVKELILAFIDKLPIDSKINLSGYLTSQLPHDYNYITNLFSEVEGMTIEKYFIGKKIEKVKELLVYEGLTLNEISYQLNYSTVAHLSKQFKKVTGLTPSHFKEVRIQKQTTPKPK